jgi:hypothetical protein
MKKDYWTSEQFEIEFNKIRTLDNIPEVLKWQIEKISKIINHWHECYTCRLSFSISEYQMSFNELFAKLASCHLEYHICDGDYNLLFSNSKSNYDTIL